MSDRANLTQAPKTSAPANGPSPAPDGKLVYKTTPAGDRILDLSYAG